MADMIRLATYEQMDAAVTGAVAEKMTQINSAVNEANGSANAAAQSALSAGAAADARINAALEPGGALRTPLDVGDAQTLAAAKAYVDQRATLVWDQTTGRYTNQSIVAMLASHADGLAYGVQSP